MKELYNEYNCSNEIVIKKMFIRYKNYTCQIDIQMDKCYIYIYIFIKILAYFILIILNIYIFRVRKIEITESQINFIYGKITFS